MTTTIIWPMSSKKVPVSIAQNVQDDLSDHPVHFYHLDLCSPFLYSVVSSDSVSGH